MKPVNGAYFATDSKITVKHSSANISGMDTDFALITAYDSRQQRHYPIPTSLSCPLNRRQIPLLPPPPLEEKIHRQFPHGPSCRYSLNPSNPSKIRICPKIRKLSSATNQKALQPSNSSQSVVTSNSTGTITKNHRRGAYLPFPAFESPQLPFLALCKSIFHQQLAYKVGTSIYTRFVSLCGGEDVVCPDIVLSLSAQQLKQIGISRRKASYLYDLANKYKTGILSDGTVLKMDDRSLFTMLSMMKGIGSWSVHMFMIFSLLSPDVLPVGDFGGLERSKNDVWVRGIAKAVANAAIV
ncbi:hypothetical protein HAX54_025133 [Datura stramonium]|uniref:HhH-GPD domain-containing protein n=1 Tax=Datura stramonium TaxID=4076 RepID=A0ABS8S605_DATST|nr:hypothetical protein [Datura stramonium]